jgi:hypothetical protein
MEVVKRLHRLGRDEAIEPFLAGLGALQVVPVDTEVATLAGRIYADLERAGRPIGRAAPLVAAAAIVHDCVLITGNVAHFEAVRGCAFRASRSPTSAHRDQLFRASRSERSDVSAWSLVCSLLLSRSPVERIPEINAPAL